VKDSQGTLIEGDKSLSKNSRKNLWKKRVSSKNCSNLKSTKSTRLREIMSFIHQEEVQISNMSHITVLLILKISLKDFRLKLTLDKAKAQLRSKILTILKDRMKRRKVTNRKN
jgi:hypothetical protein